VRKTEKYRRKKYPKRGGDPKKETELRKLARPGYGASISELIRGWQRNNRKLWKKKALKRAGWKEYSSYQEQAEWGTKLEVL